MTESFAELTPGLTRHRRQLLQKLAENTKSPELAEMAKELLAGRLTPSGIMASGVYDEALSTGAQAFTSWYSAASEQEKDEAVRNGQAQLEQLTQDERAGLPDEPVAAQPTPAAPARRVAEEDDNDDYSDRNWLA